MVFLIGATSHSTAGISTSGSSSAAAALPAMPIKNNNIRKVHNKFDIKYDFKYKLNTSSLMRQIY